MGKLIVFEGTDGSGKSTQFQKMLERLGEKPYHKLVFPQYEEPSSALIRMYLGGEFGTDPQGVNPYAASTFYGVDRYASFQKEWGKRYAQGELIVADRYTSSNAVHQGAKCAPEEREEFFRWLDDLEHQKFGLPRPDVVIYLDMPTERAVELLRQREGDSHTQGDIHEMDTQYLATCRDCGLEAGKLLGWHVVPCVDQKGGLRSIEEIHQDIWDLVAPHL